MEWDSVAVQHRVFGRTVAVGLCPGCRQSVTISQPVLEWRDAGQTMPAEYGQLEMECAQCGSTIADVNIPLDESWQLTIETRSQRKVIEMPGKFRRRAAAR